VRPGARVSTLTRSIPKIPTCSVTLAFTKAFHAFHAKAFHAFHVGKSKVHAHAPESCVLAIAFASTTGTMALRPQMP